MERNRIFEFLTGLNEEFELVCVNNLSRRTLPSLNEVYAPTQSEEIRKNVMQQYSSGTPEKSSLAFAPVFQNEGKSVFKKEKTSWKRRPIDNNKFCCNHCGKMRHTKDNCWDLIGQLEKFSKPENVQANSVTS